MEIVRCKWTKNDPNNNEYHDKEWGFPQHDDKKLFEYLVLDSFQAGLSWLTILRKRNNFRKAFDDFNVEIIANYDSTKTEALMKDTGIVRNRLKIKATVTNAQAFLSIQKEFGSFDKYIWQFVQGKTIENKWESFTEIPAKTNESDKMSTDLKKRGFKFVGSTMCYAFMQGSGMVNDHAIACFRHKEISELLNAKAIK